MTNTSPHNTPLPTYPQYKDNGLPWLGLIPAHWEVLKLKNVGLFSASGIDKKIKKNERIVKIVNYTDVFRNKTLSLVNNKNYMKVSAPESTVKKHKLIKGDLLFLPSSETYEDLGAAALIDEDLINTSFSYHLLKFRFFVDIDHNFKKYLTNNHFVLEQFSSQGKGSTRKILDRIAFKNIQIFLPPKPEQTAIADFLDRKTKQIDQAIAQKQALIERLKTYKQIIIQQAVTKGLHPDAPLKESGVEWIGQIPAHWEVRKLRNLLNEIVEKNHPNLPLLSITREQGVIKRNVSDLETNHNFIPDDLSNYKLIEKNQFGINKMKSWQGSFGVSKFKGIISPAYYVYEINSILEPAFFNYAIRNKVYISFFYAASDGVRIGQWDLSKDRMKNIPFVVPSKKEQAEIVKYIEQKTTQIDRSIALQEAEIGRLQTYKTVLIDQAVTGKIKVI